MMKFQFVKDFGYSIIKVPSIYDMKDNKWRSVILHYLIIMVFFTFPLILSIINMKTFLFSSFGIDIVEEENISIVMDDEELLEARKDDFFEVCEYFPDEFIISGGEMKYKETYVVDFRRTQRVNDKLETELVTLVFNPTEDLEYNHSDGITIVFDQYYFDLYLKGYKFKLSYEYSSNFYGKDFIKQGITDAQAMKTILNYALVNLVHNVAWIVNIALYLIFAGINILYILLLAFCARFLRYRDNNFPEYGEIVKILMYCSTIPCLVGFVLGFFGAFTIGTVLYNFILPFVLFFVYIKNKSIIKGQMSTKKAKEAEYVL